MGQNLKLAIRNIRARKTQSLILVIGLAIGIAACLLLTTVVINDLSSDHNWSKADRLYRIVTQDQTLGRSGDAPIGLGPELTRNFPEVESWARMNVTDMRLATNEHLQGVRLRALEAEQNIWRMLDFRTILGDPKRFVPGITNVAITESMSHRLFRDADPTGQRVVMLSDFGNVDTVLITGVIHDLPANSHLCADAVVIRVFEAGNNRIDPGQAYTSNIPGYLLLRPGADPGPLEKKANAWYRTLIGKQYSGDRFYFQPIGEVYLHSDFADIQKEKGNAQTTYILAGVALLILLIACINFINLSTAASISRSQNTTIRKVLGATRTSLLRLHLSESACYFGIATALAAVLYFAFLPKLQQLAGHPLEMTLAKHGWLAAIALGCIAIVALGVSLYPAWILSKPSAIVGPNVQNAMTHGRGLRQWLVGLQFSIAIALSISSLVVFRQVRFIDEHPLGYNPKGLLVLDYMNWGNTASFFQQEIKKLPGVTTTAITTWRPGRSEAGSSTLWQDPKNPSIKIPVQEIYADVHFAQLIGLQLIEGRLLDENRPGDAPNFDSLMQVNMQELEKIQSTQPCLVTRSTARRLGITELGRHFANLGTPVGIVSDFNIATLKSPMDFCIITAKSKSVYGAMLVRTIGDNAPTTARNIARQFASLYPAQPFNGRWATDMLAAQYDNERRLLTIFGIFAGLTVFLACLGLFGLVVLMLQARLKEIGIRKVLGASTAGIARMLAWGFLRLVVIAGLFAIPVMWYYLSQWLQNYAYRIDIKIWMVILPFVFVVGAALLAIFVKTIRTSLLNPVDVLREE